MVSREIRERVDPTLRNTPGRAWLSATEEGFAMFRSTIHPDPVRQERLHTMLRSVCATVSAGDQVTREQLIDISNDPTRNPLNYLTKNNQGSTNTCSANAGDYCLATHLWHRTRKIVEFSRLWLYFKARLRWMGNFNDEGASIPSVIETLVEEGCPFESSYRWQPDQRRWPSVAEFKRQQTPELVAEALRNRLTEATEVSPDFDVAIARVLLKDPIYWGSGWAFPNGPSGHAHSLVSARWDSRQGDFIGLVANSHLGHEVFECTRSQFNQVMRANRFGAYHMAGAADLRFTLQQMVM